LGKTYRSDPDRDREQAGLSNGKHKYRSSYEEVFKYSSIAGGHRKNQRTEGAIHASTEKPAANKPRYRQEEEVFKCRHCHQFVCPPAYGSRHRNHCPFCLFSRHVDEKRPGDRMSTCGESMEPIGHFQRPNGEYVIVHRCFGCAFERFNRIAADDDFALVLSFPELSPRSSREIKAQRLQREGGEEADTSQIA
jgi:hypothetical protein